MNKVAQVFGVDPGLVDTGVVSLEFRTDIRTIDITSDVVMGTDAEAVAKWISKSQRLHPFRVYVEKYRPRLKLDSDPRMVEMERALRREIPKAQFLQNMGIKQIVTPKLMEVLGVWQFAPVTHHQDLRSAARIALLGMMKDPLLNHILAEAVSSHIATAPWAIVHR